MAIEVNPSKCIQCAGCVGVCPNDALQLKDKILCDEKKCTSCNICVNFCPAGALKIKK
ncbi:MAG: 4Fe-4S binding protein [Candidatus Aenigmatarchaeota archaeon]